MAIVEQPSFIALSCSFSKRPLGRLSTVFLTAQLAPEAVVRKTLKTVQEASMGMKIWVASKFVS